MSTDPNNPDRKRLVSVEFQTEIDVATGSAERRMFVKMYFDARDSGLLANIGDRRWRTLCALATYMDENGNCHPSQARIAKDLGIHRQRVNERIQELLEYRFQGRPVIAVKKVRVHTENGGRWSNNEYRVLPITGLQIFGSETHRPALKPENTLDSANVRKVGHRPVSAKPDTGKPDTNYIQEDKKNVNVNAVSRPVRDEHKTEALVFEMLDALGDHHSTGLYRRIAAIAPEDLIYETLAETKYQANMGRVKKTRGAMFTDLMKRRARELGIDLGLQ